MFARVCRALAPMCRVHAPPPTAVPPPHPIHDNPHPHAAGGRGSGSQEEEVATVHQRARIDLSLRERLLLSLKWDSLTWDDKLAMLVQLPVTLIRRLTVPVVIEKPDDPQWKVGSLICGVLVPGYSCRFV
jgi:hypothetical protein